MSDDLYFHIIDDILDIEDNDEFDSIYQSRKNLYYIYNNKLEVCLIFKIYEQESIQLHKDKKHNIDKSFYEGFGIPL